MEQDDKIEQAFGQIAVERGLVTDSQLVECCGAREALLKQGKTRRLGEVMMARKLITKAQALELLKATHKALGDRKRIGGYELLEKLGEGAMGVIYKARQVSMDRVVALKLLPRSLSKDSSLLKRFMREAKTVARLNHPNIIRGFEVAEANGYNFFAMEYVDGGNLEERLNAEGPMKMDEVVTVALQMAEALGHAHAAGVLHRDVKPANVMISEGGVLKLADLGLAAKMDPGESSHITQAGSVLGTPHYMAPEQVEGMKDLDGRADIYALGATLYHLVTGREPFLADSALAVMSKRLVEDAPPAHEVNPEVAPGFSRIIATCMQRNRADRYQNAHKLIETLNEYQAGGSESSTGPAKAKAARRRSTTGTRQPVSDLNDIPTAAQRRRNEKSKGMEPKQKIILGVGAVALIFGIWLMANLGRIRGPQPPSTLGVGENWAEPPKALSGKGAEIRADWVELRNSLSANARNVEAQKTALNEFIIKHADSAYGASAERILLSLEE